MHFFKTPSLSNNIKSGITLYKVPHYSPWLCNISKKIILVSKWTFYSCTHPFFFNLEFPHQIILEVMWIFLLPEQIIWDTLGTTSYLLVGLSILIDVPISAHCGNQFLQELYPPSSCWALGITDPQKCEMWSQRDLCSEPFMPLAGCVTFTSYLNSMPQFFQM